MREKKGNGLDSTDRSVLVQAGPRRHHHQLRDSSDQNWTLLNNGMVNFWEMMGGRHYGSVDVTVGAGDEELRNGVLFDGLRVGTKWF